ncbi:S9 family peptidase [Hufsiella arboris]|uniref:S9 family peptidase n=1 Tax=Hufsiella arboris TaxID=2695275 RepID=UPI00210722C0|nr:DPP IV N-terminal domain-containing protein [Hufsiella arboris]
MKRILIIISLLALFHTSNAQKLTSLTVDKIMRDPKWMGVSPDNIRWSDDSRKIYFDWNPDSAKRSQLFSITVNGNRKPTKLSAPEKKNLPSEDGEFNKLYTQKVYDKDGDIYLLNVNDNKITRLTNTLESEYNSRFNADGSKILFMKNDNLYSMKLNGAELTQLTNFIRQGNNRTKSTTEKENEQVKWLKKEQLDLFDVLKEKAKDAKLDSIEKKENLVKRPKEISLGNKSLSYLQISPDSRFITYRLITPAEDSRSAIVPNYVTESGFTEDIPNRTKVGANQSTFESFIYDTVRDSVYKISTKEIPGIKDLPDYLKDYPKLLEEKKKLNADRSVVTSGPFWSEDGKNAVVIVLSRDNKDRWIMKLDPASGKLALLDRQRDEAWIGGPGIGGYNGGEAGWTDNTHFYYQSEQSGYSHLYLVDVIDKNKKQLTSGKWEVQSLYLSRNKKWFYFTANIEHPGITHFYKIPVTGGAPVKLTSMKGGNQVSVSPDEKWLAIRYSYSNKPWELYLQANKPGAKSIQITRSTTAEFNSYAWREPEVIKFQNRYGSDVYARIYQPKTQAPTKPAVIFVHGAGYLQNVHYWWSSYFREYMFNNFLADNGYTVLDIDYTASSGYGRDHRTGIYRHMGGKDLTDQVDGAKLLIENYGVDPKRIGLYGGSYGGFMTLMALFTQPDVFASGAALRSEPTGRITIMAILPIS